MKSLNVSIGDLVSYRESFEVLTGELIGSGVHRHVYACNLRPDLVVKIENSDKRRFANVLEYEFWCDWQMAPEVAKWLAPVECMSEDGRVLLMRRADPLPRGYKLPEKVPAFLTDLKPENFGLLKGKLVCVDYAYYCVEAPRRLKKARWNL